MTDRSVQRSPQTTPPKGFRDLFALWEGKRDQTPRRRQSSVDRVERLLDPGHPHHSPKSLLGSMKHMLNSSLSHILSPKEAATTATARAEPGHGVNEAYDEMPLTFSATIGLRQEAMMQAQREGRLRQHRPSTAPVAEGVDEMPLQDSLSAGGQGEAGSDVVDAHGSAPADAGEVAPSHVRPQTSGGGSHPQHTVHLSGAPPSSTSVHAPGCKEDSVSHGSDATHPHSPAHAGPDAADRHLSSFPIDNLNASYESEACDRQVSRPGERSTSGAGSCVASSDRAGSGSGGVGLGGGCTGVAPEAAQAGITDTQVQEEHVHERAAVTRVAEVPVEAASASAAVRSAVPDVHEQRTQLQPQPQARAATVASAAGPAPVSASHPRHQSPPTPEPLVTSAVPSSPAPPATSAPGTTAPGAVLPIGAHNQNLPECSIVTSVAPSTPGLRRQGAENEAETPPTVIMGLEETQEMASGLDPNHPALKRDTPLAHTGPSSSTGAMLAACRLDAMQAQQAWDVAKGCLFDASPTSSEMERQQRARTYVIAPRGGPHGDEDVSATAPLPGRPEANTQQTVPMLVDVGGKTAALGLDGELGMDAVQRTAPLLTSGTEEQALTVLGTLAARGQQGLGEQAVTGWSSGQADAIAGPGEPLPGGVPDCARALQGEKSTPGSSLEVQAEHPALLCGPDSDAVWEQQSVASGTPAVGEHGVQQTMPLPGLEGRRAAATQVADGGGGTCVQHTAPLPSIVASDGHVRPVQVAGVRSASGRIAQLTAQLPVGPVALGEQHTTEAQGRPSTQHSADIEPARDVCDADAHTHDMRGNEVAHGRTVSTTGASDASSEGCSSGGVHCAGASDWGTGATAPAGCAAAATALDPNVLCGEAVTAVSGGDVCEGAGLLGYHSSGVSTAQLEAEVAAVSDLTTEECVRGEHEPVAEHMDVDKPASTAYVVGLTDSDGHERAAAHGAQRVVPAAEEKRPGRACENGDAAAPPFDVQRLISMDGCNYGLAALQNNFVPGVQVPAPGAVHGPSDAVGSHSRTATANTPGKETHRSSPTSVPISQLAASQWDQAAAHEPASVRAATPAQGHQHLATAPLPTNFPAPGGEQQTITASAPHEAPTTGDGTEDSVSVPTGLADADSATPETLPLVDIASERCITTPSTAIGAHSTAAHNRGSHDTRPFSGSGDGGPPVHAAVRSPSPPFPGVPPRPSQLRRPSSAHTGSQDGRSTPAHHQPTSLNGSVDEAGAEEVHVATGPPVVSTGTPTEERQGGSNHGGGAAEATGTPVQSNYTTPPLLKSDESPCKSASGKGAQVARGWLGTGEIRVTDSCAAQVYKMIQPRCDAQQGTGAGCWSAAMNEQEFERIEEQARREALDRAAAARGQTLKTGAKSAHLLPPNAKSQPPKGQRAPAPRPGDLHLSASQQGTPDEASPERDATTGPHLHQCASPVVKAGAPQTGGRRAHNVTEVSLQATPAAVFDEKYDLLISANFGDLPVLDEQDDLAEAFPDAAVAMREPDEMELRTRKSTTQPPRQQPQPRPSTADAAVGHTKASRPVTPHQRARTPATRDTHESARSKDSTPGAQRAARTLVQPGRLKGGTVSGPRRPATAAATPGPVAVGPKASPYPCPGHGKRGLNRQTADNLTPNRNPNHVAPGSAGQVAGVPPNKSPALKRSRHTRQDGGTAGAHRGGGGGSHSPVTFGRGSPGPGVLLSGAGKRDDSGGCGTRSPRAFGRVSPGVTGMEDSQGSGAEMEAVAEPLTDALMDVDPDSVCIEKDGLVALPDGQGNEIRCAPSVVHDAMFTHASDNAAPDTRAPASPRTLHLRYRVALRQVQHHRAAAAGLREQLDRVVATSDYATLLDEGGIAENDTAVLTGGLVHITDGSKAEIAHWKEQADNWKQQYACEATKNQQLHSRYQAVQEQLRAVQAGPPSAPTEPSRQGWPGTCTEEEAAAEAELASYFEDKCTKLEQDLECLKQQLASEKEAALLYQEELTQEQESGAVLQSEVERLQEENKLYIERYDKKCTELLQMRLERNTGSRPTTAKATDQASKGTFSELMRQRKNRDAGGPSK